MYFIVVCETLESWAAVFSLGREVTNVLLVMIACAKYFFVSLVFNKPCEAIYFL